jgi:hypothetical protein
VARIEFEAKPDCALAWGIKQHVNNNMLIAKDLYFGPWCNNENIL